MRPDVGRVPRRVAVAGALALATFGGACGSGGTDTIALDGDPLRGTVATVDGEQLALDDFADADLVVWFWAPW